MTTVILFDKNNHRIVAKGLSLFTLLSNNKKYIFYTLDEVVDMDKQKMYVANVVNVNNESNQIDDATWSELKSLMISIAHKEDITSKATFERLLGKELNLGQNDPKKIAVKFDKIEAFEKHQAEEEAKMVNQNDEPIIDNHESFFNEDVAYSNDTPKEEVKDEPLNAFNAKPIAPEDFKIIEPTPVQEQSVENMTGQEVMNKFSNLTNNFIQENLNTVKNTIKNMKESDKMSNEKIVTKLQSLKKSVKEFTEDFNTAVDELLDELLNVEKEETNTTELVNPVDVEIAVAPVNNVTTEQQAVATPTDPVSYINNVTSEVETTASQVEANVIPSTPVVETVMPTEVNTTTVSEPTMIDTMSAPEVEPEVSMIDTTPAPTMVMPTNVPVSEPAMIDTTPVQTEPTVPVTGEDALLSAMDAMPQEQTIPVTQAAPETVAAPAMDILSTPILSQDKVNALSNTPLEVSSEPTVAPVNTVEESAMPEETMVMPTMVDPTIPYVAPSAPEVQTVTTSEPSATSSIDSNVVMPKDNVVTTPVGPQDQIFGPATMNPDLSQDPKLTLTM